MEKSSKLFDFAITISIYSEHNLNKFLLSDKTKKKYFELSIEEQNHYLINLFTSPLDARHIEYLYALEFHTNVVLKGNLPKIHLHGTIKNITYETANELKDLYLKRYIKVSTQKAILDCFKIVPIVNEGWADYMEKHQVNDKYFNDLENHLQSDYLPSVYAFGKQKQNIIN